MPKQDMLLSIFLLQTTLCTKIIVLYVSLKLTISCVIDILCCSFMSSITYNGFR